MEYTSRELMVVCAARQIHDGENVFVGMRLPLIAFALAKRTHAPNCIGLFETGTIRDEPSKELLYTMGDAPNITGALWTTGTLNVMAPMAAGQVHLGFIGGAEVDRYGNLNTSLIGDWQHPSVRLPGSGGGADITTLSQSPPTTIENNRPPPRAKNQFVSNPRSGYPGQHWPAPKALA